MLSIAIAPFVFISPTDAMEYPLWAKHAVGTEDRAVKKTLPFWNLHCVIHRTAKWQLIKNLFREFPDSPMVKDLVLSLLWLGFDLCPGNSTRCRCSQKQNKTKTKTKQNLNSSTLEGKGSIDPWTERNP